MESIPGLDDFYQQYERLKQVELDRHELIETLLQRIRSLTSKQDESVKLLRAKEVLAVTYQDHFEAAEKQISSLKRLLNCDTFVLAIIDGDDTLFNDDYIKDGLRGGERAARDLRSALLEYFKDKDYFKRDDRIVVKIYLHLAGLSNTYSEAKIVPSPDLFPRFVQGFNKTHALMEIIDAGNGKERADNKVKAEFDLFRRNVHCKQIALAGSGDNGYGGFIGEYAPAIGKSENITLIEASPFARDIKDHSDKFETIRFDRIFRSTKILTKRVSFHDGSIRARTPSTDTTRASGVPPSPSVTYANKAIGTNVTPNQQRTNNHDDAAQHGWAVTATAKIARSIFVNGKGQRVDKPIKTHDKDLIYRLKQRKLCNKHYLGDNCTYGDFCEHDHKAVLTNIELDNLKIVARHKPCDYGLDCDDPGCYHGHRCQYGNQCGNWDRGQCWFSDDMHTVEVSNVKAIVPRE